MTSVDLETLTAMLEHAPGFVVWTDPDGVIRWISRLEEGFAPEDVIGRHWNELVAPRDAAAFGSAIARSHSGPQTAEVSVETPNGNRRYLTRSAPVKVGGALQGHLHVVSDITDAAPASERVRTAALLQAQASRTAQILETMHDGYLLVGADGTILDVNAAYTDLVGRKRAAILGAHLDDLRLDPNAPGLDCVLRGEKQRFETRHRHASGRVVELEVSASTMHVDGTQAVTLFLRDVTDRNQAERQRRELEGEIRHRHKLEALGTLASGVAHEINNPIQGILGFAQLIQGRSASGADIHEFSGEIIVECGRIARIVSNLLAFARRDGDAQMPSEVSHLVLTTLSLLRPTLVKDGIDVEVDVPDDLSPIACRGDQIRQVVMNLLTNARDALNTRYTGAHPDKRLHIRARTFLDEGREWMRLEVEDHGAGIEAAHIERIFDPFFTTKAPHEGTGLGLAVSHRIVADHAGRLLVVSEPGRRTRFSVELPVDAPSSGPGAEAPFSNPRATGTDSGRPR